jgi:hypothetical protein
MIRAGDWVDLRWLALVEVGDQTTYECMGSCESNTAKVHSSDEDSFAVNAISEGFGYIDSFGMDTKFGVCSRGHGEIFLDKIG